MTAAVTRSVDHAYTFQGVTYPGVTGLLKALDKSGPLMAWAARMTAEAAIRSLDMLPRMLETSGEEGVRKYLTARSNWVNETARDLGSSVHEIAERVVRGQDTGPMTPTEALYVEHYRGWWEASGWTLRLAEAYVINTALGYGGTFDLLCRDRDGLTVLADIKTGKAVYREATLQLAAYGMASVVAPVGSETAYPMPKVDRYVVVHVTSRGVTEVEIPIGDLDQRAFVALLTVNEWMRAVSAKPLSKGE